MRKILNTVTFSALILAGLAGLAGGAQAECIWAGNHWNCPDRYIYPKSYPWSTAIINGQYQRPMSPPASDINYPAQSQEIRR